MRNSKVIVALVVSNVMLMIAVVSLLSMRLSFAGSQAQRTVPYLISYQGNLSDNNGNPISGTVDITFTIFTSVTGGTSLWQEVHPNVQVNDGAFSLLLGSITPFSDTLFSNPDLYLELEVDGVTLSPRQRFTSAPYAINADKLDGYDAADLMGSSLPSGAVVWFKYGSNPAGFTPKEGAYGLDVGVWTELADTPSGIPFTKVNCVWTGSEIVCWGADNTGATGAVYDVAANEWRTMSTNNAPAPRTGFTAVWSGSEMIVWGGQVYTNTGGRYNPTTDTWSPTTLTGAPVGREAHGAVWAGDKMMIWGGRIQSGSTYTYTNTGALYDPTTDSWTPTSLVNAPQGREFPALVWTGSKVIVWGGCRRSDWATCSPLNTGALYDPVQDTWTPMSTQGVPAPSEMPGGRPVVVWTGSEMAVMLNSFMYFYNPSTDQWRHVGQTYPPEGGSETIVVADSLLLTMGVYGGWNWYDLRTDKWIARLKGSAIVPSFFYPPFIWWTGSKIIGISVSTIPSFVFSHVPDIIYPYVKD